jgi:hypothetical protein
MEQSKSFMGQIDPNALELILSDKKTVPTPIHEVGPKLLLEASQDALEVSVESNGM